MTINGLLALWARRDKLYARRRGELPLEDRAAIRWWRLREVDELPAHERAVAYRAVR